MYWIASGIGQTSETEQTVGKYGQWDRTARETGQPNKKAVQTYKLSESRGCPNPEAV
jgi:hypothetical protein